MSDATIVGCDEGLYCTFCLGGRWFGVDARWVKEINSQAAFTPIPHAPAVVRGFVNLRGHLLLVLDLRKLLAPEAVPFSKAGQLIVFKPAAGESLALHVDQVGEIISLAAAQIDKPRGEDESASRPAPTPRTGICRLLVGVAKRTEGLLTIVDPRQFLSTLDNDSGSSAERYAGRTNVSHSLLPGSSAAVIPNT